MSGHNEYMMTMATLAMVQALKKPGATTTLKEQGKAMLFWALSAGRMDLVSMLLDAGIGVNVVDRRGRTPLHHARSQAAVDLLIRRGADVDARDVVGRAAIHQFVRKGRAELVHALLQRGGDVHVRDASGHTALHHAATKGQVEIARSLIEEQGVVVDARDKHGRHPLYYALVGGHLACAQLLIEHGANIEQLDFAGTPWMSLARMEQVGELTLACRQLTAQGRAWSPGSGHEHAAWGGHERTPSQVLRI